MKTEDTVAPASSKINYAFYLKALAVAATAGGIAMLITGIVIANPVFMGIGFASLFVGSVAFGLYSFFSKKEADQATNRSSISYPGIAIV